MEFITKVTQRLRQVQMFRRLLNKEDGLINTTDLLVATAATVVLAAGITGATLSALDEANYGKAQPDAQTLASAINNFYKDTGRWPGQAEHATGQVVFLATGAETNAEGLVTSASSPVPEVAGDGLEYAAPAANCLNNSGQGFVGGVTVGAFASATSTSKAIQSVTTVKILDLNDYLVRNPGSSLYPNWAGPYVQQIDGDPWDRAWVAYLAPLYCSEAVSSTATVGGGNLGYAWLWSGGANRTITSAATDPDLDDAGDDAGVNLGKLTPGSAVSQ